MLLTFVQDNSAMAGVTTAITTDTSITIGPSSSIHETATATNFESGPLPAEAHAPRLVAAFQITSTAPAGALGAPRIGPSTSVTGTLSGTLSSTVTSTVSGTLTLTDTATPTDTTTLVDALDEPVAPPTETATSATEPLTTVQVISTTEATVDEENGAEEAALDAAYALPIEGTIIANRTDATIRFFVEGATYELNPQRSIGLALPRVTAVLNLFNCDASTPESTDGCFWDPYLLDRDGFYEIINNATADVQEVLILQPAGSPSATQVVLQNRTGNRETIFFQDEEVELPPASVREFSTTADIPAIFYLRSCLVLPDRTVCEWSPTQAEAGIYYALEESSIAGSLPNSQIESLMLRPVLSQGGETIVAPPQVNCELQVPVLNVRSGPGLEYQIVAKIRGTEQAPGAVTATGRNETGDWLAVDERIAAGGWVTASPNFIRCAEDTNGLPIAEITDGRLAPTPEPVTAPPAATTVAPAPDAEADVATEDEEAPTVDAEGEAPTTPAPQSIPEGLALLIVNNGFEQQVRFTLDQRFRVESGPSEFDLQPGESISLLVYPGQIAFSASSPWRGLSGNADFVLEDESITLWITFVPDPDGSGQWLLQY